MEIEVLDQWVYLLEPPGDACGESQRTSREIVGLHRR